jgi:hypothetical protein
MNPIHRPMARAAERPNIERLVRLATVTAIAGAFLVASAGSFAQTPSSDKPPPAQKQPAKPGAQSGPDKSDGSSPGYAPRRTGQPGAPESATSTPKRDAASGAEKTPAKSGAQSGKQPAGK